MSRSTRTRLALIALTLAASTAVIVRSPGCKPPDDPAAVKAIEQAGYDAGWNGRPESDCPYPDDPLGLDTRAQAWKDGRTQGWLMRVTTPANAPIPAMPERSPK